MNKITQPHVAASDTQKENTLDNTAKKTEMNRRKFVELTATAALGFTIVPRHVLGGKNFIPPSDKITLGYIGMGTQGIRELLPLLQVEELQVVSVCDPSKHPVGYRDWGPTY